MKRSPRAKVGGEPVGEGAGGECHSSAFVESGEPVGKVGERGAGVYFWGKIFFKSVFLWEVIGDFNRDEFFEGFRLER